MADGMDKIDYFLSYWGLEKLMWASKYSFTNMISSLKKFYRIMLDQGLVDKKAYERMLLTIKNEKEQWLDESNFINSDGF
ncbi:MAG: hypothetical protein NC310_04725 [Roseburia sp.]|nr:hypothetical protein [Anaeroplasma bactoclasticum]MCM1196364.1 hypothetical protein [Roseburia sp.]MCM1557753.1 hypothetical protein [Anaeroplasma bactoclasticum]